VNPLSAVCHAQEDDLEVRSCRHVRENREEWRIDDNLNQQHMSGAHFDRMKVGAS
jgi:hypothetical protein